TTVNYFHTGGGRNYSTLGEYQDTNSVSGNFAKSGMAYRIETYAFIPTAQVVSKLREAGWSPVEASQQLVRLDDRRGFQKHLLRFQRRDVQAVVGEYTTASNWMPLQGQRCGCGLTMRNKPQ